MDEELFIPTRIHKDNAFGKGFGKKEMERTVIFSIGGLAIGLAIGIIVTNTNLQSILITTTIVGLISTVIGYFLSVKNSINLSVWHYLTIIKEFYKNQKLYKYKRLEEWI